MKILFTIALISSALSVQAEEFGKHLFILSGQSNMELMDPNLSFVPMLATEFGKKNIIVVKDAHSGQPILRWYKKWKPAKADAQIPAPGDLYDRLMGKVRAAITGEQIATVTFVWMQGERDAREKHGNVYAASLAGLLDQLKKDLGRNDINFVIGRLSDFDLNNTKYPHWTMVREAQVAVAETLPHCVWVNTDDLNDGINSRGEMIHNDLHCSVAGYETLGRRFAEKATEIIREQAR